MEEIILVDENDKQIGTMEKMQTHREGRMHRAFSVFIFNSSGQLLLQRRALEKYHSGGLWSNTCCSHPRPGEDAEQAAHRRLAEELGFDCSLKVAFSFRYKAELDHGLVENEFDHVLIGRHDGNCMPNPAEVAEVKWIDPQELSREIARLPNQYTFWLKSVWPRVLGWIRQEVT